MTRKDRRTRRPMHEFESRRGISTKTKVLAVAFRSTLVFNSLETG